MPTRAFYDRLPRELDAAFATWGGQTGRRSGSIQPFRTEDSAIVVVHKLAVLEVGL